jgi:hypothetical protein
MKKILALAILLSGSLLGGVGSTFAATEEQCVSDCLSAMRQCQGDKPEIDENCASESRACAEGCTNSNEGKTYSFYCRMEALTANGPVINDGTCVGNSGETYDAQLSGCQREFAPSGISAISYSVDCTPN